VLLRKSGTVEDSLETPNAVPDGVPPQTEHETREKQIRELAYKLHEQHGRVDGYDIQPFRPVLADSAGRRSLKNQWPAVTLLSWHGRGRRVEPDQVHQISFSTSL